MYSLHCYPLTQNERDSIFSDNITHKTNDKLTQKWDKITQNWDPNNKDLSRYAKKLVKCYPIPKKIRRQVWFIISGGYHMMKDNEGLYVSLYKSESKFDDKINKDIKRSFSNHCSFNKGNKFEISLRNVLIAYSNYDIGIGYCQGMNYIASFLINIYYYFSNNKCNDNIDEMAFWTFVAIIKNIRSLYMNGLPGFYGTCHYFVKLCAEHLPNIHQHFTELNVYDLILTKWFHSLLTYPSMDIEIISRIWDLLIVPTNDFSILSRICFTIIASNEKSLLKCDIVKILQFGKQLSCMNCGGYNIINKALSLKLNKNHLNKIRNLTNFDGYTKLDRNTKDNIKSKYEKIVKLHGKIFKVPLIKKSKKKSMNLNDISLNHLNIDDSKDTNPDSKMPDNSVLVIHSSESSEAGLDLCDNISTSISTSKNNKKRLNSIDYDNKYIFTPTRTSTVLSSFQ